MKYIEMRRHMAFESLNILFIMAVLTYTTRLWPILLLVLIAIFVVGLELIYWSRKRIEPIEPRLKLPAPASVPVKMNAHPTAYHATQMQITQLLQQKYPNVRWVWENPRTQEDILAGNPVYILLNKAGGYRRARVVFQNLQVVDISLEEAPTLNSPQSEMENEQNAEPALDDQLPENYSLLAFQWVDSHILDLNGKCNEALGNHQTEIEISREDLPAKESWPEICQELERNELPGAVCRDDGILIKIKQ